MKQILLPFLLSLLLLTACGSSGNGSTINNPYTDTAIAADLFPGLEGIESTEFEILLLGGGGGRSVPGPTDCKYQGYIVLSDEAAEKYASSYQWNSCTPDVDFETISAKDGDFKSAAGFFDDILQDSTYMGNAWLDENTVLFSISSF